MINLFEILSSKCSYQRWNSNVACKMRQNIFRKRGKDYKNASDLVKFCITTSSHNYCQFLPYILCLYGLVYLKSFMCSSFKQLPLPQSYVQQWRYNTLYCAYIWACIPELCLSCARKRFKALPVTLHRNRIVWTIK